MTSAFLSFFLNNAVPFRFAALYTEAFVMSEAPTAFHAEFHLGQ